MVTGRIIYGAGSGVIVTAQESILSHWFGGKSLGLVIGIQIAVSRLSGWAAAASVVPIQNATGNYANAIVAINGDLLSVVAPTRVLSGDDAAIF